MVQRVFNKIRPRFVVTKGCRVGLMDPKTKLLLSKGWKLATTHELLGDRMNMPCQGNHEHGACQGHLARESAYYTDEFVKRACRAILDGVSHQGLWSELRSCQEHTQLRQCRVHVRMCVIPPATCSVVYVKWKNIEGTLSVWLVRRKVKWFRLLKPKRKNMSRCCISFIGILDTAACTTWFKLFEQKGLTPESSSWLKN